MDTPVDKKRLEITIRPSIDGRSGRLNSVRLRSNWRFRRKRASTMAQPDHSNPSKRLLAELNHYLKRFFGQGGLFFGSSVVSVGEIPA